MNTSGNNILITGGATGIGFALAEAFSNAGNDILICGRREEKLRSAKERLPALHTMRCDISKGKNRNELYELAKSEGINVLVNNAGIQRSIDLSRGDEDLLKNDDEIEINLKAQIYLSALFIPMLKEHNESAIINVSSGLAFVPMSRFPIYCATKAAMHSFSMSLRHQLKETRISVFEVIPPTVHDTELKGRPINKTDWSVSASEVAASVMDGLKANTYEIAVGSSARWSRSSREEIDKAFDEINRHH